MPTYEYECLECKHRFEVFHSMNENPVKRCVRCGKDVRKLFSSTGLIFKGKGFYVNDYRKEGASGKESAAVEPKCAASGCTAEGCPAKASE